MWTRGLGKGIDIESIMGDSSLWLLMEVILANHALRSMSKLINSSNLESRDGVDWIGGGIELNCANSCIASGDVIKGVPGS